jgi:hypothetical protein
MVNGLLEHVIDFERSVIKSQVLEGIIVDWMVPGTYTEGRVTESPWQVYCD